MRRRSASSVAANPVLIGAVTTLVVVIGVFLAYNANSGLPFVPTKTVKVEVPNASRLVVGNDVRDGGRRIGQVTQIETVKVLGGRTGAQLTLELDDSVGPIPVDSTAAIRSRSALGLKYVDLQRGRSSDELPDGGTISAGSSALPSDFDQFFDIFDERTRENAQRGLREYGNGFAGRGPDINLALAELPELLGALTPVMRTLADPEAGLTPALLEFGDTMRLLRPVADELAAGFADAGDVFEAFSRNPEALRDTISEQPETYAVALRTLPRLRPALRAFADVSDEASGAAREIRRTSAPLTAALTTGQRTLGTVPGFAADLDRVLDALGDLSRDPSTRVGLNGFGELAATLTPTLRWAGPHVTVCNYWNYWWTYLADNLAEEDGVTGTLQRVLIKTAPRQENSLGSFGATRPVQVEEVDPVSRLLEGDPADLHAQPYGRAVDEQGNADCESGQRGYPTRLAEGAPPDLFGAIDPRTPGNQGTTFTGRPRVPEGQTFTAEPSGLAPQVAEPAEPPNGEDAR